MRIAPGAGMRREFVDVRVRPAATASGPAVRRALSWAGSFGGAWCAPCRWSRDLDKLEERRQAQPEWASYERRIN